MTQLLSFQGSIVVIFVLYKLLDYVLESDYADHFKLRVLVSITLFNLSDYCDMSLTFLEETEDWLKLCHVIKLDNVSHEHVFELPYRDLSMLRIDKNEITSHENTHNVVLSTLVDGNAAVPLAVYEAKKLLVNDEVNAKFECAF